MYITVLNVHSKRLHKLLDLICIAIDFASKKRVRAKCILGSLEFDGILSLVRGFSFPEVHLSGGSLVRVVMLL
jgi:hypothetical protein